MGAEPEAGKAYSPTRSSEIWNTFRKVLSICEREKIDLLLIAGDLFHRQPLLRELKEVDYLFGQCAGTQIVLMAGNHDYIKANSYYRTFQWSPNVHMIQSDAVEAVELPSLQTAVWGCSYHARQIKEAVYDRAYPRGRWAYQILLAHGGDELHIPMDKNQMGTLGYDYVALGHIHKPQILIPDKMAYSGALEPIDTNDVGAHGYIRGELSKKGCRIQFVPLAFRCYLHLDLEVTPDMTGFALKDAIRREIEEYGKENIFQFRLKGYRNPDTLYDLSQMDLYGNIIEILDETVPAYDFEKLKAQNRNNLLGRYIESFGAVTKGSVEYEALCAGVQALMETKRG